MPLFEHHRILAQVAGHGLSVIKLLPPLVLAEEDLEWIGSAFDTVTRQSGSLGAVWNRGRVLANQALKAQPSA